MDWLGFLPVILRSSTSHPRLNLLPANGTIDTSPFLIGPHDSASAGTFRQYEPTYGDRLSALLAQGFIRRKCQSL